MKPEIHNSTFVDDSSVIIGNVKIGKKCGIFPCAVIRGDQNKIEIGDGSNVQDCCVIHCDENHNVKIGKNVSVGHCAMVHGAIIEDNCLIGINATILNGVIIKKGSIVGANALVTANTIIPEYSLVVGTPGKVIKTNKKFENDAKINAGKYQKISKKYLSNQYSKLKE